MSEAVNVKHKDRMFGFIFGREENRRWTLDLYNAVNGSHYEDPDEIEFNTLDDVLYMGMKNDLSFVIRSSVNLYEHQSTPNPNMPIRDLMYIGKLYDGIIEKNRLNIYGRKQITLPAPKLVTFYNGDEPWDDRILKLSDAFVGENKNRSDIEVSVRVININPGHNDKLLEDCRPLADYAWLINEIKNNKKTMEIEEAVDKAVEDMPDDFLIKKFIRINQAEVKDMCLTEYDEEKIMQLFREEALEEGLEKGREQGREQGREEGLEQGRNEGMELGLEQGREQGIRVFIEDKLEDEIPENIISEKLMKRFGLSEDEAMDRIRKYSAAEPL